ncbi:MAG TPA: hypothetical protein VMD09_17315 [Solirubrobacteraceae bacterium]|nr:hypothetical protein [Solirubrobacteraceae bacterium]
MGTRLLRQRALPAPHAPALKEPLGLLLLPAALDRFALSGHARSLLAIPRVVALEPSRFRAPRWLRETIPARQVRRLRLPGEPRVIVLYDPAQYPLARGLCAGYEGAELWYLRGGVELAEDDDLANFDQLAQERAFETRSVGSAQALSEAEQALRLRLTTLEIISHRPFVPGARVGSR